MKIPFNRPYVSGRELDYIARAAERGQLTGTEGYTRLAEQWLEKRVGCRRALLVPSCTAALEMCALLAGIEPGDEVIMPSFTFVTTATAFVLRGGVPVFVDIRPDTLNLDESKIEAAVTERTRAIVAVHYAGVGCEMDAIREIADRHGLLVIEDAAQAIDASYRGRPLGSEGDLAALSFHETKNLISGEGGGLLINDERFVERAEIIREKGTDRSRFFRGEVDKYSWVDIGSSYVLGELAAAFLWAQFENADEILARRQAIWDEYHRAFEEAEAEGLMRRPIVPPHCQANAHIYNILLPSAGARDRLLAYLESEGIGAVFHYVPLHSAPAGRRFGRAHGSMTFTDRAGSCLLRMPLWIGLAEAPRIGRLIARFLRSERTG
jgi:dTDP-4-amino-4,6-dideoxygalactose transaminase